MAPFVFQCPATGMMVQEFRADNGAEADPQDSYLGIRCLACKRMHLVNPATGKVLAPGAD